VAVDYSSRDAIAQAALAATNLQVPPAPNSHESVKTLLERNLIAQCGEVDLLIRTGGEKRLSDFLLWESAYAELVFTDRMWPDFNETDLGSALAEFRRRERRFGGVPPTHQESPPPSLGSGR
jgi:undecaprenyl diphosphate synthase